MLLTPRLTAFAIFAPVVCQAAGEQAARAIVEANCLGCHGPAKMGGLDLRTREAMLKGGARGAAVVPGKASESPLYKAAAREGDLKMPPGKQALAAADVAALKQWIDSGAAWYGDAIKPAEPAWWSFRKPVKAPLPRPSSNPIDSFIYAKLAERGLTPAPPTDRRTLIRRVTFDLTGLPPRPSEIDAFIADPAPNAYAKLVDRLLESPRYGERWGRHWLDVVRYADTGGFETDVYLASAWRYRDYVIKSFNADKPYDEFVREQIAADEIWPDNLDLDGAYEMPKSKVANLERRIGTALFTMGALPVEFSFFGDQYRAEWQAESAELTASAFLGLTFGCARCHDHKFDPISQRDFYRLSAIFAGSEDREVPIVSQMAIFEYTRYQTKQVMVDQLREKLERVEGGPKSKRSLTGSQRDERETLLRQIGEAYVKAPKPYAKASLLAHTDPVPDTYILQRGDFKLKGDKVGPGLPAALGPAPEIREPDTNLFIPRRRKALAEWLTSREHPLTARVMVNRVWQQHFGRGIVATANDFGRQGDAPSHPELLDWLAVEFMDRGWSMKALHRLILTSDAYRMASAANPANESKDAENRYFWRANRQRLEAESIRDAALAVNGKLDLKMGGQPVVVPLSKEEQDGMRDATQWPVTANVADFDRRSVYLMVKRSFRLPMLEAFDAPESTQSCARREASVVSPQALALMNSEFMNGQAARFAARLEAESPGDRAKQVHNAWRLALGRAPDAAELARAAKLLESQPLSRLCLVLFNLNEFLYVD